MVKSKEWRQTIAKGLFLVLNALCILLAYSVLGFAVVDMKVLSQYSEEQASGTLVGDVIIICVSLVLIGVANVGLIGALKEHLKMLYVYVAMIMGLILLEMLIAVFVAVQRHGLQYKVVEWLREDFFRNVTEETRPMHDRTWDDLQTKYECCGLNGPEDYLAIQQPISLSCCPRAYRARTAYAQKLLYAVCLESKNHYNDGCEDEILYMLRSDAEYLLGSAVFSFWIEGAGMMLAMWVASNIKNAPKVYKNTVKY